MPRSTLSERGLAVPEQEREDKNTQDGINRLRDLIKLRSCSKTCKFRSERRLRVSAKFTMRDFSPHQLVHRESLPRNDTE